MGTLSSCTGDAALSEFCFNHPAACDDGGTGDGGARDAGSPATDAGQTDAGQADAGAFDGGAIDAGDSDAGTPDAGADDAGTDAGLLDGGSVDAGETDAGTNDAGVVADAGPVDAGNPNAWVLVQSGLEGAAIRAFAIDPNDSQHLLIATQGGVFTSNDDGASWAGVPELGAEDFLSVSFAPGNSALVYAISMKPSSVGNSTTQLFISTNGGQTFTARGSLTNVAGVPVSFSIDPRNDGHLGLVFSAGAVYETLDGGAFLSAQQVNQASDAIFAPNGELWIYSADGLIRLARGITSALENPGVFDNRFAPQGFFARPQDGGWPVVMRSNIPSGMSGLWVVSSQLPDGGPSWTHRGTLPAGVFSSPFALSSTGLLYMPSFWDVVTSNDLGANWNYVTSIPRRNINGRGDAVAVQADGRVWVGSYSERATGLPVWGEGPWLFNGVSWSARTVNLLANSPSQVLAHPSDPLSAWAIARHGDGLARASLYLTNDATTWSYVTGAPTPLALAVDPFDGQHLWLLDTSNAVWVSTNGGQSFSASTEPSSLRMLFDSAHVGVTALQENTASSPGVRVERTASTLVHLPVAGTAVLSIAFPFAGGLEGDVLASTAAGLVASTDGGQGVRTTSFGATSPCVEMVAASPTSIVCVTSAGAVFRSSNAGASWTLDLSIARARNLALDPDGSSTWVSTKDGGVRFSPAVAVWENRSNGLPFGGRADISSLSQSPGSPAVLWAAPLRRGIWRTESGGH